MLLRERPEGGVMTPTETKWLRVSRELLCPVCGRADWCLVAADKSACICPRTESAKRCAILGQIGECALPHHTA